MTDNSVDSTQKILLLLPKAQAAPAPSASEDAPRIDVVIGNNKSKKNELDEELKQSIQNIFNNNCQEDLTNT